MKRDINYLLCLLTSIALRVHKIPANPLMQNNKSVKAPFTFDAQLKIQH